MAETSRTYYYARVSSSGQHLTRQLEKFYEMGAESRDIITDKESGKDLDRPGYLALRNTILRPYDTLVITSLDRLSRRKADIVKELQFYKENHITVRVLDLPTTMLSLPEKEAWVFDMVNGILIEVLGTLAEQERNNIHERQAAAYAALKKQGRKFGRPLIEKPSNWDTVFFKWKNGEITAKKAMEITSLKRTSFYKLVKEESK